MNKSWDELNLADYAYRYFIAQPIKGWLAGLPTEEVALLNRVTQKMLKKTTCNILYWQAPTVVFWDVQQMHRRSQTGSDLFGADIAVTVYWQHHPIQKINNFCKTAFFQMKKIQKGKKGKVRITAKQLRDAASNTKIEERSFVFAVDEHDQKTAIESVLALKNDPRSHGDFDAEFENWLDSKTWLFQWLSCVQGTPSNLGNADTVEKLILPFLNVDVAKHPWMSNMIRMDNQELEIIPAKVWMLVEIRNLE